VAITIVSTHSPYPRRDGQAELAWLAWSNMKMVYPRTVTHLSNNPPQCQVTLLIRPMKLLLGWAATTGQAALYYVGTRQQHVCYSMVVCRCTPATGLVKGRGLTFYQWTSRCTWTSCYLQVMHSASTKKLVWKLKNVFHIVAWEVKHANSHCKSDDQTSVSYKQWKGE